jgi:hypothetical protein
MMTNIGKPYKGKPHVRFDEEGLGSAQPFTLVFLNSKEDAVSRVLESRAA